MNAAKEVFTSREVITVEHNCRLTSLWTDCSCAVLTICRGMFQRRRVEKSNVSFRLIAFNTEINPEL
jgi:hypothetical protein